MALSSVVDPLLAFIRSSPTVDKLRHQARDVVLGNWHLGLTAFGGPPVHFQIMHKRFVERREWINEQTYHELFAITNSLPGPASAKMLFNINTIHAGFFGGALAFMFWSLPGAVGMFCFALGVSHIGDQLPPAVYALLSGLNAATVGIIALAAVNLSGRVITDKLSRVLVFLGGTCGMLYTALWYFPVLMIAAGSAAVIWDSRVLQSLAVRWRLHRRQEASAVETGQSQLAIDALPMEAPPSAPSTTSSRARAGGAVSRSPLPSESRPESLSESVRRASPAATNVSSERVYTLLSWRKGLILLLLFLASFLTIMLIRALYHSPPLTFSLFANLYLAGTIIFGGGPVVIPLLREYIVAEGWVSPRDFLLGLALIQAFPGPNFNFAVYLGALVLSNAGRSPLIGAIVAFFGIFTPGLVVQTAFMGFWSRLRKSRALLSALRGINAAAVGLIFTAVYRLWQIGYLDHEHENGQPLGTSPWWVVVTATSFVGGSGFGLNPPSAVLLGGAMGLVWYGVTQH